MESIRSCTVCGIALSRSLREERTLCNQCSARVKEIDSSLLGILLSLSYRLSTLESESMCFEPRGSERCVLCHSAFASCDAFSRQIAGKTCRFCPDCTVSLKGLTDNVVEALLKRR